jgi:hypothetical protein
VSSVFGAVLGDTGLRQLILVRNSETVSIEIALYGKAYASINGT